VEMLSIVLKNIKKNLWVTQYIVLIAFLSIFLTFFFECLIDSLGKKQNQMYAHAFTGHFMIIDKSFDLKNSYTYYTFDPKTLIKENEIIGISKFLSSLNGVSGFEERIIINGLYYDKEDQETFFIGFAVDMNHYMKNFNDLYLNKGEKIKSGDINSCAITWSTYKYKKSLDINKDYVFLLPNKYNEYVDRILNTKAYFDYKEFPKEGLPLTDIFIDLEAYRHILGYDEKVASDIIGFYNTPDDESIYFSKINTFLQKNYPHLQVVSWKTYASFIYEVIFSFKLLFNVIEIILILLCVFLVLKITIFSILNRIKEIGTMRAIGFSKKNIVYIFTLEGFILIAIGFVSGLLTSLLLVYILNKIGIKNNLLYLKYFIGENFIPEISISKLPFIILLYAIISILAPLLPSLYSGKITIIKALEDK
jgi:ABC-type antimicrobial peptide transport system permease subunit